MVEGMVEKREGGKEGGKEEDSVNISVQQRAYGNTCIQCQPLRAEEMGKTDKQETRGLWEKCCGRTLWRLALKWCTRKQTDSKRTSRRRKSSLVVAEESCTGPW